MAFCDIFVRFPAKMEMMRELGFSGFSTSAQQELFESQSVDALRNACKQRRVSFLLMPNFQPDVGLLRDAAEHKKAFLFPISLILESRGIQRAILMGRMHFFLKLCIKFKAPYILTSGAKDEYQLKSPQELIAIGEALGLSRDQAEWAISEAPQPYISEKAEISP